MIRASLASVLVAASIACGAVMALAACEEPPAPHLVAPELATPPAPVRGGTSGARPSGACAGHSDDPPTTVLDAAVAQAASGSSTAYAELLALALAWPHSATVRVRAADAAREPGDALRLYADAVRMHDAGCVLAPDDLRIAVHGLGAGRLSAGDLPGARAAFSRAVAAFPTAAPTRYAYAATLCRLHEHDACVDELLAALGDDAPGALRELAARDPDFEAVREDARLSATLLHRPGLVSGGQIP